MAWLLHKMETSRLNRQDLNWKAKGLKAHYYIVTRLDGLSSLTGTFALIILPASKEQRNMLECRKYHDGIMLKMIDKSTGCSTTREYIVDDVRW